MKIAVLVVGENLTIFKKTGRMSFAIFEFDVNEFQVISLNESTNVDEHEHEERHKEEYTKDEVVYNHKDVKISELEGYDYIVVRAVGPKYAGCLKNGWNKNN